MADHNRTGQWMAAGAVGLLLAAGSLSCTSSDDPPPKDASSSRSIAAPSEPTSPATSKAPPTAAVPSVVVASPLPRVPGIVGSSRTDAVARLKAKGFKVTTTKRAVNSGEDDVVLSQSPGAGKAVRPGTTVRLVVADYRPPAPVPLVSNCTPGYSPCLAPASDYDCAGGSGNGPKYVDGIVKVTGPDIYDLDRDGNGYGCD